MFTLKHDVTLPVERLSPPSVVNLAWHCAQTHPLLHQSSYVPDHSLRCPKRLNKLDPGGLLRKAHPLVNPQNPTITRFIHCPQIPKAMHASVGRAPRLKRLRNLTAAIRTLNARLSNAQHIRSITEAGMRGVAYILAVAHRHEKGLGDQLRVVEALGNKFLEAFPGSRIKAWNILPYFPNQVVELVIAVRIVCQLRQRLDGNALCTNPRVYV